MTALPDEAVKEFAELYKREFGVELEPEEAIARARSLLALYRAVLLDDDRTATHVEPMSP